MDFQRVFLLKPCRNTDSQPELNFEYVLRCHAEETETTLVLDLSVLNSLMDYGNIPDSQRSEIKKIEISQIKDILKISGIHITPGYALGEADEKYLDALMNGYERFLSAEFPSYIDAPNATGMRFERVRSRKYLQLPLDEQDFYGFTYLALLKIHDILLTRKRDSPEAKFDAYLEYMDGVANLVPGLETEVAKYCFCDPTELSDAKFTERCVSIQDNFDKKGRGEKRTDRILNGARDLMYIRSAAFMDGKVLDGRKQDTWLLTRDSGIQHFNASIYFYPKDGEQAKHTAVASNRAREANAYWRYVDKSMGLLLEQRSGKRRANNFLANEMHIQKLADKAREMTLRIAAIS